MIKERRRAPEWPSRRWMVFRLTPCCSSLVALTDTQISPARRAQKFQVLVILARRSAEGRVDHGCPQETSWYSATGWAAGAKSGHSGGKTAALSAGKTPAATHILGEIRRLPRCHPTERRARVGGSIRDPHPPRRILAIGHPPPGALRAAPPRLGYSMQSRLLLSNLFLAQVLSSPQSGMPSRRSSPPLSRTTFLVTDKSVPARL
mgnify:CR=1 FL=1